MAAPSLIPASSYKVPDWAVRNTRIFRSPVAGADPIKKSTRSTHHLLAAMEVGPELDAAVTTSVLNAEVESENVAVPPLEPPPASWYKNVVNHPHVLTTIIATVREDVGLVPQLGKGPYLTPEEAKEHQQMLQNFLNELSGYYYYMDLENSRTDVVQNKTSDYNDVLDGVISRIEHAMGVGEVSQGVQDILRTHIKASAHYVTDDLHAQGTDRVRVAFELLGLTPSNAQEASPNPTIAICICYTTIKTSTTPEKSGSSLVFEELLTITTYTIRLKSSAIIEFADYLEGATIVGVEDLNKSLNSPLNEWISNRPCGTKKIGPL